MCSLMLLNNNREQGVSYVFHDTDEHMPWSCLLEGNGWIFGKVQLLDCDSMLGALQCLHHVNMYNGLCHIYDLCHTYDAGIVVLQR